MKYKEGDIIVFRQTIISTNVTAMILGVNTISNNVIAYHVVTSRIKYRHIEETSIISYGDTTDIITDRVIKEVLGLDREFYGFLKCAAMNLINNSDKYDLQILNKCNYLMNQPNLNYSDSLQPIIDLIKSKGIKINI